MHDVEIGSMVGDEYMCVEIATVTCALMRNTAQQDSHVFETLSVSDFSRHFRM